MGEEIVLAGDALRLFDGYAPEDLVEHPDLLFARLLEDGDHADLRRLFAAFGEERLASFFARHGGRTISERSRRFWRLVLGCEPPGPPALAEEIWPL